jgi:hypothetical protein
MDGSPLIREEHLMAALALWTHCEESVRAIFGETTGDPVADKILIALRESPAGLTRDEIGGLFSWNKSAGELERALKLLDRLRKATSLPESSGGRPTERWKAAK